MPTSVFGHAIETLHDGLTTFRQDSRFVPAPCPLTGTDIHVTPIGAFAAVRIKRRFRNVEDAPIEAVLTMPVAFDAVVTGLSVVVGDRTLTARALAKDAARANYEVAIDRGGRSTRAAPLPPRRSAARRAHAVSRKLGRWGRGDGHA